MNIKRFLWYRSISAVLRFKSDFTIAQLQLHWIYYYHYLQNYIYFQEIIFSISYIGMSIFLMVKCKKSVLFFQCITIQNFNIFLFYMYSFWHYIIICLKVNLLFIIIYLRKTIKKAILSKLFVAISYNYCNFLFKIKNNVINKDIRNALLFTSSYVLSILLQK